MLSYETLEHVAMQARPYPTHILEGAETGLVLFAAAFLGHNDAIHMAEAGMLVMCVDTDRGRLTEMEALYPETWSFRTCDAWHYADIWNGGFQWDVVSVDTFTGDAMRRSLDSLELWCSLASKAVTVTHTDGAYFDVPAGWKWSLFERATGVNWLVMERK